MTTFCLSHSSASSRSLSLSRVTTVVVVVFQTAAVHLNAPSRPLRKSIEQTQRCCSPISDQQHHCRLTPANQSQSSISCVKKDILITVCLGIFQLCNQTDVNMHIMISDEQIWKAGWCPLTLNNL